MDNYKLELLQGPSWAMDWVCVAHGSESALAHYAFTHFSDWRWRIVTPRGLICYPSEY